MPTKRRDFDTVVRWRRAQLIGAGFPRSLAARVARDERYDLHTLVELVENGCSPALATSMLQPIEQKRTRIRLLSLAGQDFERIRAGVPQLERVLRRLGIERAL